VLNAAMAAEQAQAWQRVDDGPRRASEGGAWRFAGDDGSVGELVTVSWGERQATIRLRAGGRG
jgi:hypothetical protein